MSISETPVSLNSNCKIAFLEHMYEMIDDKFMFRMNSFAGAYKLFETLSISNLFLDCSRRHCIYRLNLTFPEAAYDFPEDRPDELEFYCSSAKRDSSLFGLRFRLTFNKAQRLLRFLMPKFFGVYYDDENINDVLFNQVTELINITNGKIGLFFWSVPNETRFLPLIQTFAHRLNELECDASMYEQIGLTSQVFDCCEAINLTNTGQLKQILRHGMKALNLSTNANHYILNPAFNVDRGDIVHNVHLEKLNLHTNHCSHVDHVGIITTLLDACPSLKKFSINSIFFAERHEFEFDYIIRQALMYRNQMKELRESYLGSVSKKSIEFEISFKRNSENAYDHSWFEQLKEHFTDWSTEAHYYYDRENEKNWFDVSFSLDDSECLLNLSIELKWPGQRNEELALAHFLEESDDYDESSDSYNSDGCGDRA